jgi:hypothetical protein
MLLIGVDYHPSFQQVAFLNACEYSPSMEFGSYAGQLGTGHGVN